MTAPDFGPISTAEVSEKSMTCTKVNSTLLLLLLIKLQLNSTLTEGDFYYSVTDFSPFQCGHCMVRHNSIGLRKGK